MPASAIPASSSRRRTLIIACGALAREILAILEANKLRHIELRCLPAGLHNHPKDIPAAVREAVRAARYDGYETILVGYADCGTGGLLDRVIDDEGVGRLPGPHCYASYSGVADFLRREADDLGSFFLTDFLVRQFRTLVIEGLGLDRHPELRETYFANYEKVVYLAQTRDEDLLEQAQNAAKRLGLAFEYRYVGYGDLEAAVVAFAGAPMPSAKQPQTSGAAE